jgi:cell migration-inducing and hyaluronan-binding protein
MRVLRRRHLALSTFLSATLVLVACEIDPIDSPDPGPPVTARWSDPDTWPDNRVPATGDSVVIPAELGVLLDVSPPALHSITIHGTLAFDDQDLDITAKWILVHGALRIGREGEPYEHRATITLTGRLDEGDINGMGNRMLGVSSTGSLDIHGAERVNWTRLASTAAAGAQQITLDREVDWAVEDQIVIASTDFDPLHAERRTITSVDDETIGLDEELRWEHFGVTQSIEGRTLDERAEVGLLTRNITVGSTTADTADAYGAHIIVLSGGQVRIEGLELHLVGQAKQLGRYPMHWHLAGDVDGQYFVNNSIWKTFNRCVTVHGTDRARVQDNVCFDHRGHGYFLEDGAESGNVITGNLGVATQIPPNGEEILPSDRQPATFWITNPDNVISRNVAAGSRGFGFWFALPESPTGLSTGEADLPRFTPLREFADNVAHSNRRPGLNVDHGPRPDGETEVAWYRPRQDPGADSDPVVADFRNFVAYKHTGRAVWLRGHEHRMTGAILADNGIGATFASSETFIESSLFVGESANNTVPLNSNTPYRGFEFYDGRVGARDVTFVNYNRNASIPSSALGFNRNNGFSLDAANFVEGLEFVNANPVYIEDPHADKDGDKAAVFLDEDGTVTGAAGRFVVANTPILVTPSCSYRTEWNAHDCGGRYIRLQVRSETELPVAPVTLTRDDNASLELVGVPNNSQYAVLSLPTGRAYTLAFANGVPLTTRLSINDSEVGDWLRISLPYPSANFEVIRDYNGSRPIEAAASLAELDGSDGDVYFYDAGTLHLKAVTREGRDWANLLIRPGS